MTVTIGEKLESFYLALLTLQSLYNDDVVIRLADVLYDLENHIPTEDHFESPELLSDVLKDVRKKSAQAIRTPYVETVNQLIVSSRKRLKAKAALSENDVNFQHGQRYVHILLELLGSWSNIIVHLMNFGFSKEILQFTLSPLHQRVIEMSKECFNAMKVDKDLDNWCMKLMQSSFPTVDSDGFTKQDNYQINLATLDNFSIQLSSMRSIINQHYLFLFHTFLPYFHEEPALEDNNTSPDSATKDNERRYDSELSNKSYSFFDQLLIATKEELLQWKEIDMMYITLETSYLQRSIIEACLDFSLISLEENIYIFQLLEDSNFLFHKVLKRSYQTNEEKCMFMIGNKILELLQFQLAREKDQNEPDIPALFASIVQNKRLYYYSSREHKIVYCRTLKKLLSRFTGRDYLHGEEDEGITPPVSSIPQAPRSNEGRTTQPFQTPLKPSHSGNQLTSAVSSLIESNTGLKHAASYFFSSTAGTEKGEDDQKNSPTTAASASNNSSQSNFPIWNEVVNNASLVGVNQWIGWASPLLQGDSKSPPPSSGGGTTANNDRTVQSPTRKLPSTMEELLLQALDLNEDGDNKKSPASSLLRSESTEKGMSYSASAYYYDYQHLPFFSQLIEADFVIYLNCVLLVIKMLLSLRLFLVEQGLSILSVDQIIKQSSSNATQNRFDSNSSSKSSIWMLIQEYWKCEQRYEEYLLTEIQQYIHQKYMLLERKQREEWLSKQQSDDEHDFSALLESASTVPSSTTTATGRKYFSFKRYVERNLDITGQEMEEWIALDDLKKYYLLLIQQFPFSPSYFHLPEDKSLSTGNHSTGLFGFTGASQLPSFLVNPLSFFQEPVPEVNESQVSDNKTKPQEQGNKSYLSETHYVMILSETIIYLLRSLFRHVFWGEESKKEGSDQKHALPKINEWGALLLHEEIISLRKYYEGCIFHYQRSMTDAREEDSETIAMTETKEFRSLNDRNYYYIEKAKQYFSKVMNLMMVLTLDLPQDIKRYTHLIESPSAGAATSIVINESGPIPSYELYLTRKENSFTKVEVQYLLSRRSEFIGRSVVL